MHPELRDGERGYADRVPKGVSSEELEKQNRPIFPQENGRYNKTRVPVQAGIRCIQRVSDLSLVRASQ